MQFRWLFLGAAVGYLAVMIGRQNRQTPVQKPMPKPPRRALPAPVAMTKPPKPKLTLLIIGLERGNCAAVESNFKRSLGGAWDLTIVNVETFEDGVLFVSVLPTLDLVCIANQVWRSYFELTRGCRALAQAMLNHRNKPGLVVTGRAFSFITTPFRPLDIPVYEGDLRQAIADRKKRVSA